MYGRDYDSRERENLIGGKKLWYVCKLWYRKMKNSSFRDFVWKRL